MPNYPIKKNPIENNLKSKFESINDFSAINKIDWAKTYQKMNLCDSYNPPKNFNAFLNNNRYDYIEIEKVFSLVDPGRFWDSKKDYPNIPKLIKFGFEDPTTSSNFIILAVPTITILQNGDLKKLQEATVKRAERCLINGHVGEFIVTVEYLFSFFEISYELDPTKFPEIFHPEHFDKIQYIGSYTKNEHTEHFMKKHGYDQKLAEKLAIQMKEYQDTIIILRYLFKGTKYYKETEVYHVKSNGFYRIK